MQNNNSTTTKKNTAFVGTCGNMFGFVCANDTWKDTNYHRRRKLYLSKDWDSY